MFLRSVSCRNHYNVPVTILQAYISLFHDTSVKERYDLVSMKLLNLFIVIQLTKLLIRFAIIFAKLLNIRDELRDDQEIIRIFIFIATEQINCKGALNIRESRSGIPFLKKLGCYLIKDLKSQYYWLNQ